MEGGKLGGGGVWVELGVQLTFMDMNFFFFKI